MGPDTQTAFWKLKKDKKKKEVEQAELVMDWPFWKHNKNISFSEMQNENIQNGWQLFFNTHTYVAKLVHVTWLLKLLTQN